MLRIRSALPLLLALLLTTAAALSANPEPVAINIAQRPLYLGGTRAPYTMLIMGRDHSLYYEAYNDASDLTGDGVLDVGYQPQAITYFGYFDSFKCYVYHDGDGRFVPVAVAPDKTCSDAWSGDFLNYLTTSRIDALRKVLYGGQRVLDTPDLVVLERSYIPQDAHSWGKEYRSIAHDGYDLTRYTPLPLPASGTRHLFANTTLLKTGNNEPLLRVLTHSPYRIWEWVAIERPVAGHRCLDGGTGPHCVQDGSSGACSIVPEMQLTQTTYRIARGNNGARALALGNQNRHPENRQDFDRLENEVVRAANLCGSQPVSEINGGGNPFAGVNGCDHDEYLTIFEGHIDIDEPGQYTFAVDGDDAVEFSLNGEVVAAWYGGHGRCSDDHCRCRRHTGTRWLPVGRHQVRYRHEERLGQDFYYLRWSQDRPPSTMTDYVVRMAVCDPAVGLEPNCRVYPAGTFKPVGVLQKHGEDERMHFGLLSGSYTHPYNMRGGVLRKNIGSIADEIDLDSGAFTDEIGIIRSIDQLRIVDFNRNRNYEYEGGWLTTAPMSQQAASSSRRFPDWGNPIAEMMYEAVRYFAGQGEPTPAFMPGPTGGVEAVVVRDGIGSDPRLHLPMPAWTDPFAAGDSRDAVCSAGAMLVISDVNPSYDTQYVPGSAFSNFGGDLPGLNVAVEADAIWAAESPGGARQHYIGQVGSDYDGTPSEKTVSGLGNIRGLSPAEPTKEGGYYSAAIARYAFQSDLRPELALKQNLNTVVVALASPLPRIEIPVGNVVVTIVPFAKSVGGSGINAARGAFQPTNQIVDFFVDTFANTDPDGSDHDPQVNAGLPLVRFRINFEDVEQGADHDMDAIVVYEIRVNPDQSLTVQLDSEYAAGSIIHHLGYVISGTTQDGVYLEVRDQDTAASQDPQYFLDTPAGWPAGACSGMNPPAACAQALPLQATRNFVPSPQGGGATVLPSPLWYAAKYGTSAKAQETEQERLSNYFLVTNAARLEQQLEGAFVEIFGLVSSASAAATNSTMLREDSMVYQARFDPDDWSGEVRALRVTETGALGGLVWSTSAPGQIAPPESRRVFTHNGSAGLALTAAHWGLLTPAQCAALLGVSAVEVEAALANCSAPPDQVACDCDDLDAAGFDVAGAKQRLDWLRGDRSQEPPSGNLRARTRTLGDIVNSDPHLVDTKDYGLQSLAAIGPETDYDAFRAGLMTAERRPVLYVGANDGMLHGFDGDTGAEVFAFMPQEAMLPQTTRGPIAELTSPDYQHRYFLDGSPWAMDAFIAGADGLPAWRTVLVGSTGAGGRAVFALDVTDPDDFDEQDVLWEFRHPELGFSIGRPTIARVAAGDRWVAIFGNGYNSQSASAQLFIVDLATGELLRRFDTGRSEGDPLNGMASPVPVDQDGDRITDLVYAGDLRGRLWRFDLQGETPADWAIAFAGEPLFTATDENHAPQPITNRPAVARHPFGGLMVLFGTGKFFSESDLIVNAETQVQTFYGIRDQCLPVGPRDSALQAQEILYEGDARDPAIRADVRAVSAHPVNWAQQSGWYLDLWGRNSLTGEQERQGERVVDFPVLRTDRVVFVTLMPPDDPADICGAGGSSWLMELDYLSGGRLPYSVFDLNEDGLFGYGDMILLDEVTAGTGPGFGSGELGEVMVPVSAIAIPAIAKIPAFLSVGNKDVKYSSLSSGALLNIDNRADAGSGRQSWRQLR